MILAGTIDLFCDVFSSLLICNRAYDWPIINIPPIKHNLLFFLLKLFSIRNKHCHQISQEMKCLNVNRVENDISHIRVCVHCTGLNILRMLSA